MELINVSQAIIYETICPFSPDCHPLKCSTHRNGQIMVVEETQKRNRKRIRCLQQVGLLCEILTRIYYGRGGGIEGRIYHLNKYNNGLKVGGGIV